MRRLTAWAALATMIATMAACTDNGCSENGSALPLAAFYQGGQAVSVSLTSVRGIGAPGDSLISGVASLSQVYLPLSPSKQSASFELKFRNDTVTVATDTITLSYRAVPTFVSHECGAMFNYEIHSWNSTRHAIDSVQIPDPVITNAQRIAIKIHLQ